MTKITKTRGRNGRVLTGKKTLGIDSDLSQLNALLSDMHDGVTTAVRPAAQAAAQVIYDKVKANVRAIQNTGNLDRAIYQKYSPERSSPDAGIARYHISWNHQKAPHGHLVEFGHWQRYAVAFIADDAGGGRWVTLPKPEKRGKPRPGRKQFADYYQPRKGGAVFVPGKAFLRGAQIVFPQAAAAGKAIILKKIEEAKNG